jgi:hypothetical protein
VSRYCRRTEGAIVTASKKRQDRQPGPDEPAEEERADSQAPDGRDQALGGGFYRGAQSETRKEAGHSGRHWAEDELAIITRLDISTKEAALMLGRTYASVARRRHLLRRHQNMTPRSALDGAG